MELPENASTRHLLELALQSKIAFVPGGSFFPNNPKENTLRLNYSNMSEERIDAGLQTLGGILKEYLARL
jgi:2-aminoadipate transaminase